MGFKGFGKLEPEGGGGFNPRIKPAQSMRALALAGMLNVERAFKSNLTFKLINQSGMTLDLILLIPDLLVVILFLFHFFSLNARNF